MRSARLDPDLEMIELSTDLCHSTVSDSSARLQERLTLLET